MSLLNDGSSGRRVLKLLLLVTLFSPAACNRGESDAAPAGRPGGGGPGGRGGPNRIVPVELAQAELGSTSRAITATGTVEPIRTIGINSQMAGILLAVNVEEGNSVRAGAVLARIDARELQAQLASAEASLEVARRAAERAQQLYDQKIVTAAEYERDQAAFTSARATRDQLRTRIGYATIQAPIAGVVLEKRVETGDVVGAQSRLFVLGDISTLVVRVPVSELDVAALRPGAAAELALDAVPGATLEGRVRRIFPRADSLTRLVPVEVQLTQAAARVARPGFLARVTFHLQPRDNVLLVPVGAIVEGTAGPAVFVVSNSIANRRPVQRGVSYQGKVEILNGVAPGDTLVVAGSATLRDGATVRAVGAPPAGPRPPGDTSEARQGSRAAAAPPTGGTR
jgi:membrane fusion protein, multidrug efflux system